MDGERMNKYLGWNYFGSQGKVFNQLKTFIEKHLCNFDKYSDLTAGGGSIPYLFAKEGKQIYANDVSYYSYMCNKAVLCKNLENNKFMKTREISVIPTKGFLYNNWMTEEGDKKLLKCNKRMIMWLEGLLQSTKHPDMIACIGKTLISVYGFKGIPSFGKTLDFKRKSTDVTLKEFKAKLCQCRDYLQNFKLNSSNNKVTCQDAKIASKNPAIKDSVVYVDPAWPYNPKMNRGDGNPYIKYTNLSNILSLGKQKYNFLWSNKTPDEDILKEVGVWVSNSFKSGAKAFIINTQNTNRPDPDKVFKYFKKQFPNKKVIKEEVTSKTNYKKLGKDFTLKEYYILIKNVK